jgi:hypothetical protein
LKVLGEGSGLEGRWRDVAARFGRSAADTKSANADW